MRRTNSSLNIDSIVRSNRNRRGVDGEGHSHIGGVEFRKASSVFGVVVVECVVVSVAGMGSNVTVVDGGS
jgi:hypothetical protein